MHRLFAEQPVDEVLGFNSVIGSIKTRLKRQHDFFIVIADTLQRRKLPFAHIFAHHGLCYLDILFLVSGRCDEIHLGVAYFTDRYIIAAAKQFKVNDILNGMAAVTIAETQQIIAKSDVDDIILSKCAEVGFALDVKAFDLVEEVALQKRI